MDTFRCLHFDDTDLDSDADSNTESVGGFKRDFNALVYAFLLLYFCSYLLFDNKKMKITLWSPLIWNRGLHLPFIIIIV